MPSFIEHITPENGRFFLAYRQEWSERSWLKFHAHQGLELLFIHEGVGTVEVEGRSYPLEAGALFCFQPYQLHKVEVPYRSDARYVRTNLTFDPRILEPYLEPYPQLRAFLRYLVKGTLPTPKFPFRQELFAGLIESHAESVASAEEEPEEARILFLLALFRLLQLTVPALEKLPAEGGAVKPAAHIEAILDWIEGHFRNPFRLEELAGDLHLSSYYVSHLFKQYTGVALSDHIAARRIREACVLLGSTDKPVERIAQEVGGLSAPYFGKLFKRHKGMTPLAYRSAVRYSPIGG
ncbi:helix-turn-helix domain-containing protein [Gorillibacterium sp. sgz500922]|uniref:helix-turn-helix domain-containing protein n=1 Tax=Gorillibacterium sp. sgz500922 TaxID=3446694 RepID=UPI003F666EE0